MSPSVPPVPLTTPSVGTTRHGDRVVLAHTADLTCHLTFPSGGDPVEATRWLADLFLLGLDEARLFPDEDPDGATEDAAVAGDQLVFAVVHIPDGTLLRVATVSGAGTLTDVGEHRWARLIELGLRSLLVNGIAADLNTEETP